jgi:hypothetical protein
LKAELSNNHNRSGGGRNSGGQARKCFRRQVAEGRHGDRSSRFTADSCTDMIPGPIDDHVVLHCFNVISYTSPCVNKVTWSRFGCQMRAWGLGVCLSRFESNGDTKGYRQDQIISTRTSGLPALQGTDKSGHRWPPFIALSSTARRLQPTRVGLISSIMASWPSMPDLQRYAQQHQHQHQQPLPGSTSQRRPAYQSSQQPASQSHSQQDGNVYRSSLSMDQLSSHDQ